MSALSWQHVVAIILMVALLSFGFFGVYYAFRGVKRLFGFGKETRSRPIRVRRGMSWVGVAGVFACGFLVARSMSGQPLVNATVRHESTTRDDGRVYVATHTASSGNNVADLRVVSLPDGAWAPHPPEAPEAPEIPGMDWEDLGDEFENAFDGDERPSRLLARAGLMANRAQDLARTVAGGWRVPYSPEHDERQEESSFSRWLGLSGLPASRPMDDSAYALIHILAAAMLLLVWLPWSQNTP